jgi:hypothetical protein
MFFFSHQLQRLFTHSKIKLNIPQQNVSKICKRICIHMYPHTYTLYTCHSLKGLGVRYKVTELRYLQSYRTWEKKHKCEVLSERIVPKALKQQKRTHFLCLAVVSLRITGFLDCQVSVKNSGRWTKSRNLVILSVILHRQNPSNFTRSLIRFC